MNEDKPKEQKVNNNPSMESILKIVSTLIAVSGFIFGIFTFQTQQRTTQTQNFKMKLWERKLEVYNQLAGITGDIIIYRNDSLALDSLADKFDKIYYSSLILVQNDSVEAKVRVYKDALADYRQNIKSILYLKEKQVALMKKTNLEEASVSVDSMKTIFEQWGATKGIILKSSKEKLVNSKDIFYSLDQLVKLIKNSKAKNPCILFYYAGHGFSSKEFQALYLPNGEFTRNPDSLSTEDWEKYSTTAVALHEKLQNVKLPHYMFFDCCYSGKQDKPERLTNWQINNLGLKAFDELPGDTYTIFTAMNQMVGPNPVIFSAKAGDAVATVPLNNVQSDIYVAPLCRRILMLNKEVPINPLSNTKEWMNKMLDKNFDTATATAVSYWVPEDD